ncbi:hypothetical protein niasHT_016824 [Heterodera trifolii]|uniref:Uncharacterized protein n=1 Tax=Heterodera trifolii TaxID=157864 RepID=A0ABD2KTV8_9BILA
MSFSSLTLQMLIISTAFTGGAILDLIGEETEKFIQFKVLPPGPYKLIFWNKFTKRFYGDLDPSKLFTTDANGNLKFKLGALRRNKETAISERFFDKMLQSAQTKNGEFIIRKSEANGGNGQTHVTIVPLDVEMEPFALEAADERVSDIAEQTDRWINTDRCPSPTVLHYHSIDQRNEIALGMFDRWLFDKGNSLSRADCFFVEAYLQQMDTHLKQLIHATKGRPPAAADRATDFELYFDFGFKLSLAFRSGQLAVRALMIDGIMVAIKTLCETTANFRRIVWRQKQFEKLEYWDGICLHLNELRTVAESLAIDRWLTIGGGEIADQPLQMGDANALTDLVEHLLFQMQSMANNGNGQMLQEQQKWHKSTSALSIEEQINQQQTQMFAELGQKLEKARKTNAQWAGRVAAVSGMMDLLNSLCETKSAIATNCGDCSSEWTRAAEAWDSFCPHLDEAQNERVLGSVKRWLKGEEEVVPDENSLMEMNLEHLVEKMEPYGDAQLDEGDVALLHKIGLELDKAKEEKRLAGRVMTAPGIWDQLSNICILIGGFVDRAQTATEKQQITALTMCWEDALCGQLEEIYVSAVMNALERWRAGATNGTDAGVIIGGSRKALQTMDRVAGEEGQHNERQKTVISKTEMALIAELGAYFAEVIEAQRKAGPQWRETSKTEPIGGMDKMLKKQCKSWTEFRRKVPPKNRKMFISWSKICKAMNLKETKKENNGQIRDKMDENILMKREEEKKEKKSTKRKEEKPNN